jgi:hypothetical protein
MTPPQTETATPVPVTSVDVAVAVLTEKVTQVIGDHERRISALEQRRETGGTRIAQMVAPFIAGAGLVVLVAGKINWT